MSSKFIVLLWCLTGFAIKSKAQAADSSVTFSSKRIAAIELKTNKTSVIHINIKAKKLCCFVFFSPECPLSKNYSPLVLSLQKRYKETVAFYIIVPGKSYTEKEIKAFSADYLNNATVLTDRNKKLVDYLKATITPEVILLDGVTGSSVYRGAIDNWAFSLGRQRPAATAHYLQEAVDQHLKSEIIITPVTRPVGCHINDF